jgi:putative ABC transport system ATP-binding protein
MDTGTWTIPGIEPVIVAENVNHWYGAGSLRKQTLFDINLRVLPGEIVILTGPSGSGKTTLLTLLGALRSTQEGSLRVMGQEMRGSSARERVGLRQRIGYIFQAHNLLASLTARNNVELAVRLSDEPARERPRRTLELLEAVGLGSHADQYPGQLSGGQKQRVAVARALAVRPRIVLADEPTASLDAETELRVMQNLGEWGRERAIFLVTHRLSTIRRADQIVYLREGRVVEAGSHGDLMTREGGAYRRFVELEREFRAPEGSGETK